MTSPPSNERTRPRTPLKASLVWLALAAAPVLLAALLVARPDLDGTWENHPAHFWLVLLAACASLGVGFAVSEAARRRRDARLLLLSFALIASAGFLGLHALATPGVLVGKNTGFELATPIGLLVASGLAAASGIEYSPAASARIVALARSAWVALGVLFAAWAVVSLAELPPLAAPLEGEELEGWQRTLTVPGVLLYAAAALLYYRLYRRRGARFVFAVAFAFALLADAMIVIAIAANWRLSWWEWHVLMLAAFAFVAYAARTEWHEERFTALYLEETFAGAKEVSVLFADLEGFTRFAERRPPNEVAEMINAYWARLVPLLEEGFQAEVHQLIGDAVMAVWNKDGDVPDHAERAARAALALAQEAETIAREHPDWPRFRVGVNSGEVLAGVLGATSGKRQHGIVGDTVNLAARLEGEAAAGEVVIGRGTYERLGDTALVDPLGELAVKGKADPVEGFVLRGFRPSDSGR
ncbi:MAG: adenylate/guanylate cyclase domain-containing protein [Actinobacteria bacterium]|nr:adenylate/guanylate cyclase domain-containing protein [Actinomycetota bacterium]